MLLKYHDYERDLLLDLLADLDLDLPLDFERDASLSALDPALSADLDLSRDLDFERSLDFDLCSDLDRDLDVERRLDLDLSLDLRSDRDRSLFLLGLLVLDRDLLLLLLLDLLLEYDLLLLPLDLLRLLLLAPGSGLAYFAICILKSLPSYVLPSKESIASSASRLSRNRTNANRDFLCYTCHEECKCLQSFHTFQTDIQDPCHWYDMSDYPPSATPYPSHLGGCLDQTETCFFSTCLL